MLEAFPACLTLVDLVTLVPTQMVSVTVVRRVGAWTFTTFVRK